MTERFENFLSFDIAPEVISSLIVMGIILILCLIVGIQAALQDPLKKPKGLLLIAEIGTNFFDGLVENLMGPSFKGFGGYIMIISVYLFLSFIFGLCGLPSPMTNLAVPFSLGFTTLLLIHIVSARYTKWRYFKRYIEPIPIFLPINLISMWAPLLSLTLRLFGNAIAGMTLMSIVYNALNSLSAAMFSSLPGFWQNLTIAPFITWILHLYFDLFSGFIQTTVFIFLTMCLMSNEVPDECENVPFIMKGGK